MKWLTTFRVLSGVVVIVAILLDVHLYGLRTSEPSWDNAILGLSIAVISMAGLSTAALLWRDVERGEG